MTRTYEKSRCGLILRRSSQTSSGASIYLKNYGAVKKDRRGPHVINFLLERGRSLMSPILHFRQNKSDRWYKLKRQYPGLLSDCQCIGPVQHAVREDKACSLISTDSTVNAQGARVGNYILQHMLGKGTFAQVYLARSTVSQQQEVAIKVLEKRRGIVQEYPKVISQKLGSIDFEIWFLRQHSHHPNIIGFYDAIHAPKNVYIVMERGTTSLRSLAKKGLIAPESMRQIMKGVLNGVQHLHRSGVYHLDLKLSNVLVVSKTELDKDAIIPASSIRLCDFGLSQLSCCYDPTSGANLRKEHSLLIPPCRFVGTLGFAAPELVLRQGADASAADMWSVGCIVMAMLHNAALPVELFAKNSRNYKIGVLGLLSTQKYQTELEENEELKEVKEFLYKFLLRVEADERPSAGRALRHRYFQSGDDGRRGMEV